MGGGSGPSGAIQFAFSVRPPLVFGWRFRLDGVFYLRGRGYNPPPIHSLGMSIASRSCLPLPRFRFNRPAGRSEPPYGDDGLPLGRVPPPGRSSPNSSPGSEDGPPPLPAVASAKSRIRAMALLWAVGCFRLLRETTSGENSCERCPTRWRLNPLPDTARNRPHLFDRRKKKKRGGRHSPIYGTSRVSHSLKRIWQCAFCRISRRS